MRNKLVYACLAVCLVGAAHAIDYVRMTANDGNLIMEDVPPIPQIVMDDLNRFQNVRSARMLDWASDGQRLYVNARFADVNQIHRVDMPGGARRQLTFFNEPVNTVRRRPGVDDLLFLRDIDGAEFSQMFILSSEDGSTRMLSDGQSRNGSPVWDRDGRTLAFLSTRRNGASNDVWLMDADDRESARAVHESSDGSWWGPQEFSASGSKLLLKNYVSIARSSVHLLDLDSGTAELLAGNEDEASSNVPIAFDEDDGGYWLITDAGGEFGQLAWQATTPGAPVEIVSGDIQWEISNAVLSNDRRRLAFIANENGMSRLYLLDTKTREYRPVDNIPTGQIFAPKFSPDDTRLAMSLSTAKSPSDTFVLHLGEGPLDYSRLVRWTESEVGGLNTAAFVAPELVHYPTFDKVDSKRREIPAWYYKPEGEGPFPVVIAIHGGPEGQSRPYFSSTYQMWLAKLGVAIIAPNVRGSSGYGKSYLALDNGFNREDSVKDIGALLDWIEQQPDLDQDRVAVYGGSYGGYMVLASAVHYSKRLKAAVDVVGISNFVTFLENTQDYRRDLRRQEYGDEREPAMRRHLEKISPLNNVNKIRIPLLVVQGQNDPRVPVSESEQLVFALRKQGLPVWYMNAMNEGHGYKKKENRDIYQQAMVLFFRQYLIGEDS